MILLEEGQLGLDAVDVEVVSFFFLLDVLVAVAELLLHLGLVLKLLNVGHDLLDLHLAQLLFALDDPGVPFGEPLRNPNNFSQVSGDLLVPSLSCRFFLKSAR